MWRHRRWLQEGRPIEGNTADMRRITRAMYHRQVKKVKKQKATISKERMANTLYTNNYRDLWKDVHKTQKSKRTQAVSVDNITDKNGIN